MTWTIPDKGEGQNDIQSILFQEYLDVLTNGINDAYVVSGCAVTAQGSPNMTVAVAAGVVYTSGLTFAVTGANGTITTADTTNPRLDIVVITSAGAIAVRAGTAAAAPKPPALTAGDVALAYVYVPANDTTISSDQIVDLRVIRSQLPAYDVSRHYPVWSTDFLGATGADTGEATYAIWDVSLLSTGTQSKIAATAGHPGILRLSSSATANSGVFVRTDVSSFIIAGGETTSFIFRPQTLTTTTIRMGYIDTATSADCVDGVYFEIPSTGAAVGKTSSNSTRTTSATIATLTTNTWYRGEIEVNDTATSVTFYIYSEAGALLGSQTVTTNIPTAAGRETGHGVIATNSGTTAVALVDLDYMDIFLNRRLAR